MAHSETVEAIVLKTHDVGEADRFCILFTRERGKIAARARGVRKPTSRFGGSILPLGVIQVEIREGSAGFMICHALRKKALSQGSVSTFLYAQQGIELLLNTLQDEEPLPEIFDATLHFLEACEMHDAPCVLPFTLQLLHLMGLLPQREDLYRFGQFSNEQMHYIEQSLAKDWGNLPQLSATDRKTFSELCARLISEISTRPLQTGAVIRDMLAPQA